MTREEQLKFCNVCTHRKNDPHQGIICSLTDEKANFEDHCENYSDDKILTEKDTEPYQEIPTSSDSGFFGSWKSALLLSILGFVKAALRGFQDIFGIIFLLIGIIWLIVALSAKNKSDD